MHRIDSPGATGANLFTEGNPSLGIPATEVSDDWLNDVQEELCNFIENQGVTLAKGTQSQLETALNAWLGTGGAEIKIDPLANNTADQVITGLIFDKLEVKAAIANFDVHRETDSSNVQEIGQLFITHDSKDDAWKIASSSHLDDAGLSFTITSAGQVRVTTDDLTGTSYDGQLRVNNITRMSL